MSKEIKIAIIIAIGIVVAVIANKSLEYYLAYGMLEITNKSIKKQTEKMTNLTSPFINGTPTKKKYKVWVKGRPLKWCMGNSIELNADVHRCRNGYFKEIYR